MLLLSKMNDIVLGDDFEEARKRRDAALANSGGEYDPTSDEFSALVTISSGARVSISPTSCTSTTTTLESPAYAWELQREDSSWAEGSAFTAESTGSGRTALSGCALF